jgi:TPR repeat protein
MNRTTVMFGTRRAEAQVNLGIMYDRGYGVPQDYKEAVQ